MRHRSIRSVWTTVIRRECMLNLLVVLKDGLPLPAEIFTIIAEFLIGENNFGSLANLNATTHLIREATNAVLWTTVLLDTITPRWNAILDKARSEGGDMMYDEAFHKMAEIEEHATRWKAESESLPNNCRYVK